MRRSDSGELVVKLADFGLSRYVPIVEEPSSEASPGKHQKMANVKNFHFLQTFSFQQQKCPRKLELSSTQPQSNEVDVNMEER